LAGGVFHYTDKKGFDVIRSQPRWKFKASQPRSPDRPFGVYFTTLEPTEANLRVLHKKLRVPKTKQEYVFHFIGTAGLGQLNEGRGRDRYILFSPQDYEVDRDRQRFMGPTASSVDINHDRRNGHPL
jgi:hypothetical protein